MTTGLIAVFTLALATTAFAGRAFPVKSENLAVELFSSVNPSLEWDESNYVVDLSGWYAVCKNRDVNGVLDVEELTPEGEPITGVVASYPGDKSDADTVNSYIAEALPQWLTNPIYSNQIKAGEKFGCSVQPSCTGNYVIACLFSTKGNNDFEFDNQFEDDFQEFKAPKLEQIPAQPNPIDEPKALAFTPEQYEVAEKILGQSWDRSHFLENLSGQETDCGMVTEQRWGFTTAANIADNYDMEIETFYGVAENEGETEPAMVKILEKWQNSNVRNAGQVGCSIIPDCQSQGKMFVVVSCIRGGSDSTFQEVKGPETSIIPAPEPDNSKPKAFAFTKKQYKVAEDIFGKAWDSSHYLENLSGKETDCAMLRQDIWGFPIVKKAASEKGVEMEPVFGVTRNEGSTEEGIVKILKAIDSPNLTGKVGCSVIPDCKEARGVFVVVSCIFSE